MPSLWAIEQARALHKRLGFHPAADPGFIRIAADELDAARKVGLKQAAILCDPIRNRGLPEDVRRLSETIRKLADSPEGGDDDGAK